MSELPPVAYSDGLKQAEDSLRDSEQRLRLATEAANMFAWEVDIQTRQIKWAGGTAAVIGCAPEQLTDDPARGAFFVFAGDRERIAAEFQAAVSEGRDSFDLEFRGTDAAAGRAYWRSHGRIIRDTQGKPLRALAVTQNITAQKNSELDQIASVERLRTVEMAAGALIYDFDRARDFMWRGEGLSRMLGWNAEDIPVGEAGWASLRHPEDAKVLNGVPYDAYVRADDHYTLEYRVRHRDGHYVWVLDSGRVFRDAKGKINRVAGAAIDISERKRSEAARTIQANLIELSFEPIIVWHPERGIVDWNKGAEQLYGYSREEALGTGSHTLLRSAYPMPVSELMVLLNKFKSWTGEIEQRAKDGRPVTVDSRHQIIEIEGESLVLETNHDISQRKRAERYEARMAAVASSSHDALFGATLDGIIETWNPAAERLFGYEAREAIGQPMLMLSPPGGEMELYDHLNRVRTGESVGPVDTKRVHRDGSLIDVAIAIAPVRAPDGSATSVSVIVHAITERKEWEARQRMMNRELAHRVKNSFAVLQSILRATLRASPDPKDFAEAFSGRLHSLAAAQDILTATDWKFAELGMLTCHQLSTIALHEGDRLTISGPPVHLAAEHSVPLALIFNELATNAIKYGALSNLAGKIRIRWHVETPKPREPLLILTWQESGGPRVAPPARRGFGSTLIEKSLAGAKVERHFEPEGILCRIELPLAPAVAQS